MTLGEKDLALMKMQMSAASAQTSALHIKALTTGFQEPFKTACFLVKAEPDQLDIKTWRGSNCIHTIAVLQGDNLQDDASRSVAKHLLVRGPLQVLSLVLRLMLLLGALLSSSRTLVGIGLSLKLPMYTLTVAAADRD